ncbi:MAG: sensor domain-containing diguanylate cyclase [Azonexus sp.]
MNLWNDPGTRSLLAQLLLDLDSQLASAPPDEAVVVESVNVAWPRIKDCLARALEGDQQLRCHDMIEELAGEGTPFMLFSHQFGVLRNLIIHLVLEKRNLEEAKTIVALFEELEEEFAAVYLRVFLNRLGTRNHLRLSHIQALSDKNLLSYFESHLEWVARLVESVSARDPAGMPELDPSRCQFGSWLNGDGAKLIRDKSHISQIRKLHEALHHVVSEVGEIMSHRRASGPTYALLKKAETYSLELGNEISLLNSIVIMSVYNKDPLTGFLNRRFLDRVLINQMEIAKATESAFSVIMFDIDHFKKLNDKHGHNTGDRALEHIATIVRETLRQSDLVFRYGGEEFLLVAPSTSNIQAHLLAEKLRQRLQDNPLPGEPPIPISASFGVTEIAPASYAVVDTALVRDVIAECDGKLYAAKRRGRNRVV